MRGGGSGGGGSVATSFPAPLLLAPRCLRTPFLHLSKPVLFPVLHDPLEKSQASAPHTCTPTLGIPPLGQWRGRRLLKANTVVTFRFSQAAVTGVLLSVSPKLILKSSSLAPLQRLPL